MILPATLSAVRNTFLDEKQRNIALGIWATVGGGGAAFGPLLGGFLLEHFNWGSVFDQSTNYAYRPHFHCIYHTEADRAAETKLKFTPSDYFGGCNSEYDLCS
jgi:hypothetical protein